jgi:hypothetical protein
MRQQRVWGNLIAVIALGLMTVVVGTAGLARTKGSSEAQADEPVAPAASKASLPAERSYVSERTARPWTAGGGIGLLGSTPDGTAVALNGYADYRFDEHFSLGPLLQLGFTGDMAQVGLSGQGKYRASLPGTEGRGALVLQSGVGFVHADRGPADTSWLVPIGAGIEYEVSPDLSLESTMLVNFTDLHAGPGGGADVMPGVTFGLRF